MLVEEKNSPTLSFWDADSLTYEFSSGYKGQGPNDVIFPRPDYFYKTDSSFFILDSNIEREIRLDGKAIHIVRNTPIFIPDAINQLVRVNDSVYIMSGFNSGEGDSHIRFTTDGNYTFFGPYPPSDVTEEQLTSFLYKFTAGREDKDVIIDFYQYINLIRIYTVDGELKKEIVLEGASPRNNVYTQLFNGTIQPFFYVLTAKKEYIAVLYYENFSNKEIYNWKARPELQIWTWNGELIKRMRFDKSFDNFTISDDNRLYATNQNLPYTVYTCDLDL